MKNFQKIDVILWAIIILATAVHFYRHLTDLVFTEFPPALDTYLFASQSLALLNGDWALGKFAHSAIPATSLYPPMIIFVGAFAALVTGQSVLAAYTWLGPLLGALLIPFTYWSLQKPFGKIPAAISAIALGFSSIMLNRTLIALPENIGFFFIIAFLGIFLQSQKAPEQAKSFWKWTIILIILGALTHFTVIYIPLILATYLILNPKKTLQYIGAISRKAWLIIGSIILALILIPASPLSNFTYQFTQTIIKFFNESNFGLEIFNSEQIIHYLQNIFIVLGGLGGIIALRNIKQELPQKLLIATLVLGSGAVLFRDHDGGFNAITADRFYPFLAIALALLTGYLAIALAKNFKWLPYTLLAGLIILLPFYSYRGWDYTFTKDEYQAATWLENTPEDSVIVSSAILSWLIPPASGRDIFWRDPFRVPLVTMSPKEIQSRIEPRIGNRPVYIFISKNKLSNCFVGIKTDGYFTQCHEQYVPDIDLENFQSLKVVFENNGAIIYALD